MDKVKRGLLLVLMAGLWIGCRETGAPKLDTPTSGSIKIAVDETLKPLLEAEEKAFEGLYSQANIQLIYVPETEAAEMLLNDSVRMDVLCRKLTLGEEEEIRRAKIYPTATKIASDAIALIVHLENPDTLMS